MLLLQNKIDSIMKSLPTFKVGLALFDLHGNTETMNMLALGICQCQSLPKKVLSLRGEPGSLLGLDWCLHKSIMKIIFLCLNECMHPRL